MAIGTLIRYGLPISFLHCTIYQQDIWREVDDQLLDQQRGSWRCLFGYTDNFIRATANSLGFAPRDDVQKVRQGIVDWYDKMNWRTCWNSKVASSFEAIDQVATNPQAVACKMYRKFF